MRMVESGIYFHLKAEVLDQLEEGGIQKAGKGTNEAFQIEINKFEGFLIIYAAGQLICLLILIVGLVFVFVQSVVMNSSSKRAGPFWAEVKILEA